MVALLSFAIIGCNNDKKEKTTNEVEHLHQLIGKWQLQEVNNGVKYYITFHNNSTISQVFLAHDRHSRLYNGLWSVKDDTLHIRDARGEFHMLIS